MGTEGSNLQEQQGTSVQLFPSLLLPKQTHTLEEGQRREHGGPTAAHLFSDDYKGSAQELIPSTAASCPTLATLQLSVLRCVYSGEYSAINTPTPFPTFSPVNC